MDPRPVKIYCTKEVVRLKYIAAFIMEQVLGLSVDVVTDKRKLGKYPVINYSGENISGSFKITPVPLLFETGVSEQEIQISEWKGLPSFFPTKTGSDLPFDIFAASFFLITRYEEYYKFQPDNFGRFNASSSIACKYDFLHFPVVDLWIREFAKVLLKKFQTITFRRNVYTALLTVDTDQSYPSRGKNLLNSIGGLFQHIMNKTEYPGREI